MKKGQKMSREMKSHLSKLMLEKSSKDGYKNPMKGEKRFDLSIYNINVKKGKSYEEIYGKKKAQQIKKKHSETFKKNIKEGKVKAFAGLCGSDNPNWKGGISFGDYSYEFNKALKEAIKIRDGYKCKICGKHDRDVIQGLCIHHIDYDKTNNTPENLVSLCHVCHSKTNSRRQYWVEYFSREFIVQKEKVSWYEIHNMCASIADFLKDKKIGGLVPVLRGGVIPAVIIANILDKPIKFQRTSDKDVFVDEIVDFGLTLKRYKKEHPKNLFVCMDLNVNHFKLKIVLDFYVREVDKFIVYPWEKM